MQPIHGLRFGQLPAEGGWLKAIDFGCAQHINGSKPLSRRTGTPVYMVRASQRRQASVVLPCGSFVPRAGVAGTPSLGDTSQPWAIFGHLIFCLTPCVSLLSRHQKCLCATTAAQQTCGASACCCTTCSAPDSLSGE